MVAVTSATSTIDREVAMFDAATADPGLLAGTLSREQQAVVDHESGPLLVFAGPGSGKTRTITERIAALIRRGVPAHEILALTFTVRATEEMRVRLIKTLGQEQCQGLTVSTFHGLCNRMLRRHAGRFGRSEKYSIYDETDLRKVVVELVKAHRGDAGDAEGETLAADVARIAVKAIAMAKCKLVTPAAMREHGEHPERELIADLWELLEAEMRSSDAFDFQDLLTYCVSVLDGHDDIRGVYRARWRHILVDEFQDTDVSQFQLLLQLAGPEGCGPDGSLVVVGDDDQAVYGFRGAHVGNLLDFQDAFPGARKHLLRRNYRCSRSVLRAAMACIRNNQRRESKALVVRTDAPEGSVTRRQFPNEHAEAMAIAREIKAKHAAGVPLTEIAALCRTLRHTKTLQQQLTAAHIPHRVIGSHSLWERVEVQDALAYLTLVANPHDAVAFKRAIAAPTDRAQFTAAKVKSLTRGVGDARQKLVVAYAHEHEIDLLEACINAQHIHGIGNDARAALVTFGKQLSSIRYDLEFGRSIFHAVIGTLTCDGGPVRCYEHLLANTEDRAVLSDTNRVLEDLRSLTRAAQTYESEHGEDATLAGFLAEARIEPAEIVKAGEDNRMTVSTIHGAKGTEYRAVYVMACEERVLPSGFALDAADPAALEEERRLAYIAMTRAREDVICTTVSERVGDRGDLRRPSRFLAEAGL
jgi:DNA helicase-2/ATP-dependent DNA helicase PcrA